MQAWHGRLSCAVRFTTRRMVSLPFVFCFSNLLSNVTPQNTELLGRFNMLSEMLLVCDQAKERRRKTHPKDRGCAHSSKPLALEYIADRLAKLPKKSVWRPSSSAMLNETHETCRIDTDDPVWGFTVRSRRKGWLQGFLLSNLSWSDVNSYHLPTWAGFVTVTTFTTWHSWFHWDSLAEEVSWWMLSQRQNITLHAVHWMQAGLREEEPEQSKVNGGTLCGFNLLSASYSLFFLFFLKFSARLPTLPESRS